MEVLKSLGLDPDLLSEEDIFEMEDMISEMKLPADPRSMDPREILAALDKSGINVKKLLSKMRGNPQPKKSTRVKRNAKCPCKSGKKYKKCCGNMAT